MHEHEDSCIINSSIHVLDFKFYFKVQVTSEQRAYLATKSKYRGYKKLIPFFGAINITNNDRQTHRMLKRDSYNEERNETFHGFYFE